MTGDSIDASFRNQADGELTINKLNFQDGVLQFQFKSPPSQVNWGKGQHQSMSAWLQLCDGVLSGVLSLDEAVQIDLPFRGSSGKLRSVETFKANEVVRGLLRNRTLEIGWKFRFPVKPRTFLSRQSSRILKTRVDHSFVVDGMYSGARSRFDAPLAIPFIVCNVGQRYCRHTATTTRY